jgi:hypothetical protein
MPFFDDIRFIGRGLGFLARRSGVLPAFTSLDFMVRIGMA